MSTNGPLSGSNAQIKRLRRLSGRRSSRVDEGVFILEGPTLVREAIAAGVELERVYVDEDAYDLVNEFCYGATESQRTPTPALTVQAGVLSSVLSTKSPQPVCAVAAMTLHRDLTELVDSAVATGRPLLVLVDISDPGNAGTMLRTAEASGCAGVVVVGDGVDVYNPKVVRSSAGSLFRGHVALAGSIAAVIDVCESRSVDTVAAIAREGDGHLQADLAGAVAIVIGNEAHGLSASVVAECARAVTITMDGPTESLNAAMAATVLCFEAWRQRSSL